MSRKQKRYIAGLVMALLIFVFSKSYQSIIEWKTGEELFHVSLVRVVDGDTIVVEKDNEEIKVRLIGINAAESVHSDESKNTEEGRIASEHLKEMLDAGDSLYIQYDVEKQDIYGRTLAYVWLDNDVNLNDKDDIEEYMLNAILVKEGYAEAKEYPPNTRYADVLEDLEK